MTATTTLPAVEKLKNDFIFVLFYTGIESDVNSLFMALHFQTDNIKRFDKPEPCWEYVKYTKNKEIILIITIKFAREFMPILHDLRQLHSVYVYDPSDPWDKEWTYRYVKIHGVYPTMKELVVNLTRTMNFKLHSSCYFNTTSTILLRRYDGLYFKFLIQLLLRLEPKFETAKNSFVSKCREYYSSDPQIIAFLEYFNDYYSQSNVVYLYTTSTFVFRFINEALRNENISAILLSHFIIVDLFKELQKGYAQFLNMNNDLQSCLYYRGQQMSVSELEEMKLSIGEFTIVKSFFSASADLTVALAFAGFHGNETKNEKLFVLFEIMVDVSVKDVPFSDLTERSSFKDEREVLFAAGSMFCIEDITYDTKKKVWMIQLNLVGENDQRLLEKFDYKNTSTLSLASQISKVGHLIRCALRDDVSSSNFYYNFLLKELPLDNLCRAACYSDLGWNAYYTRDSTLALSNQQIALEMCDDSEKNDEQNELRTVIFNALGVIYHSTHTYELALEYYNKASDLNVSFLPVDQYSWKRKFLNNPTFNIARWHKMANNFELALMYYDNLVKTATLRKEVHISIYDELSKWYDGNFTVNNTQKEHRLVFIDFSTKYLPQFHNEIAEAYNSVNKSYEALEIFLNYAPSDERSILGCYENLALRSHKMGDYSHEIEYSEKYFELLKRSEIIPITKPAFIYAGVASAYFSTGQTALAIDRLEKAIKSFKTQYQLETTPNMPYRSVVRKSYNDQIAKCYIQLADLYRDTGNSEAADDAMRTASTDQITVEEELDHDIIIRDLVTDHTVRDVYDQKVIDALLIAQTQVKQTNIFKCLNAHELQWIVHDPGPAWNCNKCGRVHLGMVPKWRCWCVPHCYDKCDICIAKELFYFNSKLVDSILRENP